MLFKDKESAVLDIGSGNMTLMVATKTMGDYCRVTFEYSVPYEGIRNGEFVDDENAKSTIKKLFQRLREKHGRLKKLYVGIPAEFSICRVVNTKIDQIKHKKVEKVDIDTLVSSGNPFVNDSEKVLISADPIYFNIDNDDEKYIDVLGKPTNGLNAHISYIASEKIVYDFLKQTLKENGISDIVFLSSPKSEILGLFNTSTRDVGAVLVDTGYRSTSLIICCSDGIEYLFTFSVGRYNIIDWISKGLDITFEEGKNLIEKVDLSFNPTDETYSINSNGFLKTFSCKEVKDMTVECIKIICTYITKCFDLIQDTRVKNKDLYLTGSGLDFHGIESCMANCIGKPIMKVYPNLEVNYKKSMYSRIMGLVNSAIKSNN